MNKITKHPILEVIEREKTTFNYNGQTIEAEKGATIAAALHQAGFPVHSHSLKNRERSLECGIGKCGACEMLVNGKIQRICITKVDNVTEVAEIPKNFEPNIELPNADIQTKIYKTKVAIIGAGPAGLAAREELNKHGIDNIVVDNNDKIGGQFLMQTHQFFFFENEKKFGGMRGFDIAKTLAGENEEGIFLNSVVWDILEGKRLAIKNILTEEIYYIDTDFLITATGAVPFMPTFENDDLPGVYTAAVVQKMMNNELTLLGKNILTIGAGNIGYLTSYQLMQAGAKVRAIVEAQNQEGGFPVQANRVRRLGIPILLSTILLKAIPNEDHSGIVGAVIADCENFNPIAGTEREIRGIDAINICTGLVSDDQLLIKGIEIFGRNVFGAGDSIRIGEGTSAVLRGKQVAFEILQAMDLKYNYNDYLKISKEYIDSQQHPTKIIETPYLPSETRKLEKPFVIIDCLYGFACNPCVFACPHGAISKNSTSSVPKVDYDKCIGCMDCVYQCPGLAIFGFAPKKDWVFLPLEYEVQENADVYLVDNFANIIGEGKIEKILKKANKTNIARIKITENNSKNITDISGFLVKEEYDNELRIEKSNNHINSETYVCHCDDVTLDEILEIVGDRKFISVDEIKHTTRLGMGACRGKRCIPRLKQTIKNYGITVVGEATPRGPMSNQLTLGELYPKNLKEIIIPNLGTKKVKKIKTEVFIAGGGIGGSSLFRYFAEAGKNPVLANYGRGASWRNIAGGRPNFSLPELSDIAVHNLEIFKELQNKRNINFLPIQYVTFAHDDQMQAALEASCAWSDAELIKPNKFKEKISEYINPNLKNYQAALITNNCWQATPGKTIDLIRQIGIQNGGEILEDTKVIDIHKQDNTYFILLQNHEGEFIEYSSPIFVNALGPDAGKFSEKLGLELGLYTVKHQAFITRRLPLMGINGSPLPMIIDRRKYKGFSAVYGQQLAETGQIIGCASPQFEPVESGKNIKTNTKEFIEISSEVFCDWFPKLSSVGIQAIWSGYYVEPRMIIDTDLGLFTGLRGQGFMLSQYLAKMYVDKIMGKYIPEYFNRLSLQGDGLLEKAFK